jgi:hypothetical protein
MTQPLLDFTAPVTVYEAHRRDVAQEVRRRTSAKARILARLQQGPALNTELNAICYRYGARILELRREGYDIRTEPQHGGLVRYTLYH